MKLVTLLLALLPLAAAQSIDKAKTLGKPGAPVVIELFCDFQAPKCRAVHQTLLPQIMKDYVNPGKVYLVNREYPLPTHSYAREAAVYATAAARVGKYAQVADALYQNQPSWSKDGNVFETVSTALTPAEQQKVQALAKDSGVLAEVQADIAAGQAERINQTPTGIIVHGGKKTPWTFFENYALLKNFLDSLLK
jgi:protein-disulfide isomerase